MRSCAVCHEYLPHKTEEHIKYCSSDCQAKTVHGHRADGTLRMTQAQRDRLWALCGSYNVPFSEDHYQVFKLDSSMMPGWAEGWIGGKHGTLYVGVSPEGDSHS